MKIEISSEVERLTNEINNLREELMHLLDEKHELMYDICPKLRARYYELFGALETESAIYAEEVKLLNRRLELIRQQTNRGEPVDITEINKQIELETNNSVLKEAIAESETELQTLVNLENSGDFTVDNEELKKLYKRIAKALHPDLHPEFTEKENRLFIDAIDAYKKGDIDTIRLIEAVTRTTDADKNNDGVIDVTEEADAADDMQKQKEYIVYGIDTVREEINQIKKSFPYNIKSVLEDPKQVEEIQNKLRQVLEDYKALYRSYRTDYDNLMKENDK